MSKKYPRFDSIFKTYKKVHPNGTPPCELCDKPAIVRIFMEVNYMNGDDEDFRVCDEHLKLAKSDGEGFYKAYFAAQENDNGKESSQLEEPVAQREGDHAK